MLRVTNIKKIGIIPDFIKLTDKQGRETVNFIDTLANPYINSMTRMKINQPKWRSNLVTVFGDALRS